MVSAVRFQLFSMVRGYHEYQHIWDGAVGETLQCHREDGNVHDPYAVSVKKGSTIVGHAPKSFHACVHCFYGGVVIFVVRPSMLSSDLPQGGLEIPCDLVFEGNLKEIEKIKKLIALVESDPPPLLKRLKYLTM